MSKGLHPSNIDYIAQAKERIGRPGYVLNIITGCKHGCEYCYARRMVEEGRLKGHKSYPYGFKPTFHLERIRKIGGKPKLIFLNDMGDVGGDWSWKQKGTTAECQDGEYMLDSEIARKMVRFANLNPSHILLLLTKNPSWYRYAEWPDNVWCGFSATNNIEYSNRAIELRQAGVDIHRSWVSLEPWLDEQFPLNPAEDRWLVVGGLSGKDGHGVSHATHVWLRGKDIKVTRFAKDNCRPSIFSFSAPREYPDEWKIKQEDE